MKARAPSLRRRSAAELALAVLAGWAVLRFWPLEGDDPFRSSLAVLPLAVAALRALERHAPRRAGFRRELAGRVEGAALAVLLVLTLGRRSLGLATTDGFLAGGYLLLLAHRVARLLYAWFPALAQRRQRPPAAFFLLPLLLYLVLQPWQAAHRQVDGDEPFYLLLTHSLVHDFDAELGDNYARQDWRAFMDRAIEPQPGDPRGAAGEIYSRHNVLLPLALAPAYLVAGRWGAMATMAVFSAALAWLVLRLALGATPVPRAALTAYAVFAFSPPLLVYSYQIWIEVPAALVVAAALDRIRSLERAFRPRQFLLLALLVALLPLLKLRLGLVALPLAGLAIYRVRPPRRALLAAGAGVAAVFAGLFVANQLRYGNVLKIHSWGELNLYSSSPADFARGLVGMFYDVAFGLFPCAPIWLLLLPAAALLLRRRRPLAVDLAVVALPYLLALAPRFEWYGGWSPAFRYPLVFLPLLALALVPLFELRRRPGLRALAAALGALTLVLALVWVVVPGWTYDFADGRTHLLDAAGARFGADVARFFPSAVRPRSATWLWPPLTLLAIPLALWKLPGRRWRRSAAALGIAALLVAAAALPLLARSVPTRVIEVEDAWVTKERGVAFPDAWVLQRPRYRGGWVIPPRGRVAAPLVPGGESLRLRLTARVVNPSRRVRLRIAAGGDELAAVDVPADGWQEIDLGPFAWPAGAPLVIRGGGARFPGRAAVDRVEAAWE